MFEWLRGPKHEQGGQGRIQATGGLHPFDPFLLIGDPPRRDKARDAELIKLWQTSPWAVR